MCTLKKNKRKAMSGLWLGTHLVVIKVYVCLEEKESEKLEPVSM